MQEPGANFYEIKKDFEEYQDKKDFNRLGNVINFDFKKIFNN